MQHILIHNIVLSDIGKQMRDYLLLKEITITVEYLPRVFNQEADFKSRSMKDSSESKLKPQIFQALCNIRETPDIDLFVSQVSHQRPCYKFPGKWTHSARGAVFQTSWKYQREYAFPPFNLIGRALKKFQTDQAQILLVPPNWQSQTWYPRILQMPVDKPILIPQVDLLNGPKDGKAYAAELITSAKRQGSIPHYESVWGKWNNRCSRKQVDPISDLLNLIFQLIISVRIGMEYNCWLQIFNFSLP